MAKKFIDESLAVDTSTALREKLGTEDLIDPETWPELIKGLKPAGSLEGLENGWDVMFYDEYNEGLAFYSIKQGHTINPPVYNVKAWQKADGTNIVFPYTPTEDVIFYALNSTYADQLYEFYGIDKGVYPYLAIAYDASSYPNIDIVFGDVISATAFTRITFNSNMSARQTPTTTADYTDIEAVCSMVMNEVSSVSSLAISKLTASTSATFVYSNFDASVLTACGGLYRLDE